MTCHIMVQLIKKLDEVRAEQINPSQHRDDPVKKRRLRVIQTYVKLHQKTCTTCQRMVPLVED
jgi:hypothetical protein